MSSIQQNGFNTIQQYIKSHNGEMCQLTYGDNTIRYQFVFRSMYSAILCEQALFNSHFGDYFFIFRSNQYIIISPALQSNS